MTKKVWFGVAVISAYVMVLFQFGEYQFFLLSEAGLQTTARMLIVISLGFVMWWFIPNLEWSRVVSQSSGNWLDVRGVGVNLVQRPRADYLETYFVKTKADRGAS